MEESDHWLSDPERPPNFYYRQQESLAEAAQEQGWDWVVTYPNDVIGVAKNNFMNLATTLGIYCVVNKEMGEELMWPGCPDFYTCFDCFTSSKLHAKFNLWAALEKGPQVSNQAFNVVNGDIESWHNMWPRLAEKFGMRIPERMFTAEEENGKMDQKTGSVKHLIDRPPIIEFAASRGLKDTKYVAQSRIEQKIDLVKWSKRDDVREAWNNIAQREGLDKDAFDQATWAFLGSCLGRNSNKVISMNKAWKAGFTGWQDTWDSLNEALDELVEEKVLPKFQ